MPSIGGSIGRSLGALFVRLGLDSDDLDKGADKARGKLKFLRTEMNDVVKTAGKVAVSVGAVGAGLIALVYKAGETAREIRNLSQVANASTREFQRNAAAARTVGIENEKLADIYKDMTDRIGDFLQTGAGPMADFFEKIAPQVGVTAEQFRRLSGPEALQLFVESLEKANLSQQDMTFYMEQIASDSTRLLPLLRNNGRVMRELGDEAERTGQILDDLELKKLEDARKTLDDLKAQLGTSFTSLIADNAEMIADLAEQFGTLAIKVLQGVEAIGKFFGVLDRGDYIDLLGERMGIESQIAVLETQISRRNDNRETQLMRERLAKLKADLEDVDRRITAQREADAAEEREAAASSAAPGSAVGGTGGRVSVRVRNTGGGDDTLSRMVEIAGARADMAREGLESLRNYLATEAELEVQSYESRLATLIENRELRLITEEEFNMLEQELEQDHVKRMNEIYLDGLNERQKFESASMKTKVATVTSHLVQITAGVSMHNKRMFALNKAAGIANAIISAYEGISKTLAAYPYPINIGLAAAHAAAAFAQVSAIKSSSFGGGGGAAPSLAGGTAASPVSPVGGAGSQTLIIKGLDSSSLFSGKQVRDLAEALIAHQRDGGKVLVT